MSMKNWEPPVTLSSNMLFELEATNDYRFILRLWYVAKQFIQFLCYRKDVHFSEVNLASPCKDGKHENFATMHVFAETSNDIDTKTLKDGRYIKQAYIGRYYASDGKDLSGGQWQLLCLTRAYFQNAPIMVLDEPSASLDPISERKVFDQLYDLNCGKGSIIITHQLSNIRLADRILLLDKGKIAETGTHDELIGENGIYSNLYRLQASKYM